MAEPGQPVRDDDEHDESHQVDPLRVGGVAPVRRAGALTFAALALLVGMTVAHWLPWRHVWMVGVLGACGWVTWDLWRGQRVGWRAYVLVACVAGCWYSLNVHYTRADDVRRYLMDEPQLARVTGRVLPPVKIGQSQLGAFSAFDYRAPVTTAWLELDGIEIDDVLQPASGRLVLKVEVVDHALKPGMRIEATGWMALLTGPQNPGEFDYKAAMGKQGVHGRITLPTASNWKALEQRAAGDWLRVRALQGEGMRGRDALASRALASLNLGLNDAEARLLLERLVLGVRDDAGRDLDDAFRAVGLAHVLSISGAHLTILMGLFWCLFRLIVTRPGKAARLVGAVLVLYMLAVPWRVPIVRSAIMAGVFCAGFSTGRRLPAMDLLGAATLIVLLWRPADLTNAGFQLSFGVVAGLLLFTPRLSALVIEPRLPHDQDVHPDPRDVTVKERVIEVVIVSTVAFCIALPLTAYHFSHISPLAILLSVLALLPLTGVLAIGFVKTFVGMVFPSVSLALAPLATFMAKVMVLLVSEAQAWPGVAWSLRDEPNLLWCVAMMGVVTAGLSGWVFVSRRRVIGWSAGLMVLSGWLVLADGRFGGPWYVRDVEADALVMDVIAVGDGSCFLLRSQGETLLYDCGSADFSAVGVRSVAPALTKMGVTRLDRVVISHADMDHYAGILDVAAAIEVGEVLVSPQMLQRMRDQLDAVQGDEAMRWRLQREGYLLQELVALGVPVRAVSRGWEGTLGDAQLTMLWPPAELLLDQEGEPVRDNDLSLVLEVDTGTRRVRLNGDIGELGMQALMADAGWGVDVTDLPHHGSFVEGVSPLWIDALSPAIVMQSSGPARLRQDAWADTLGARPDMMRHITAFDGCIELTITGDGEMNVRTNTQAMLDMR